MTDWIEKYRPDYSCKITRDYVAVDSAPLILMNINVDSDLSDALYGLYNASEEELFVGNQLVDNWVEEDYSISPDLLKDIKRNKSSFVCLIKQYLKLYYAIEKSEVVLKSPNTIRQKEYRGEFRATDIMVTELIIWADSKNIPVDEGLRTAYSIEQKISLSATAPLPPTIKRGNDFNKCIAQVIADFTEANDYAPTSVQEVLNRMKHKPPFGYIVNFHGNEVSIEGSKPKRIENLERAIKRLLGQQKKTA